MKAEIKAPRDRKADTRDRVGKLILTADSQVNEVMLAAIAYAIFPIGKRDKVFDDWMIGKVNDYCLRNNVQVTPAKKPARSKKP